MPYLTMRKKSKATTKPWFSHLANPILFQFSWYITDISKK